MNPRKNNAVKKHVCRVISQIRMSDDIYCLCLYAPDIAVSARPGQFVHLRITPTIDPLLRRPFSIHRVKKDSGCIEILYRVVGRGTSMMADLQSGIDLDLLGPLGNAFTTEGDFSHAVIVAGGMGSAPAFFLVDALREARKKITFLWGVRSTCDLVRLEDIRSFSDIQIHITSEDGSTGRKGMVTSCLDEVIQCEGKHLLKSRGYVCGPKGMIRAVQKAVSRCGFPWQASLEEHMACGVGVCLGCGIRMAGGGYNMVCSDGPVFDLSEVILDD